MSAPQLPQPFGKYILLNKIAMGGMAEIYRAKTIGAEGFEKEVVIKRILPHFTEDEAFVTMFIDEAKVSSKLTHPNIVQIFDFDSQDEMYYISMEYVEGKDLKRVVDVGVKIGKPLTVAQIVNVNIDVCKGLHYAHTKQDRGQPQNIVHRDVSPHNVMVSYDGDVKVMDFGIAKAAARSTKTRAGTVKGKCAYMSPEQARGKNLDGRSDMFAVGVMMWEMLTNRRLFAGESDFETLSNVLKQEAPPPSSINADVPPELDAIILKCLSKDRDERQADCRELARELDRWLSNAVHDRHTVELGPYMQEVFAEDIRALRDMQRDDNKTGFVEAHGAIRASRTQSQAQMAPSSTSGSHRAVSGGSRSNVPAASNDARTLALDVSGGQLNSERTVAVDASSLAMPMGSDTKKKGGAAIWIIVALTVIGGGVGGFFWWQSTQTPAPAPVVAGVPPAGTDGAAEPKPKDGPAGDPQAPKPNVDTGAEAAPEPSAAPDVAAVAVPVAPPEPKVAKLEFHAIPSDATIEARDQKAVGVLMIEAKSGEQVVAVVTHPDYEQVLQTERVGDMDRRVDIALTTKKAPVAPVEQAAVLEFTVTPADAQLSVKGQAQTATSPGLYRVEGYRVGEDIAVEVTMSGYKKESETLRITSADLKKSYELKKNAPVQPSGPGKVSFKAKPWAKVSVAGKSCLTTCTIELPSGKHSVTFEQGGVVKRASVTVKADQTVSLFLDMTQ
jgi:serine/threonine protein kinase